MIRKIVFFLGIVLSSIWLLAPAASAESVLPADSSLAVEPASVTWPSAPDFEYRLTVRSGPEGADFSFHFPRVSWGPADVGGSPFSTGDVSLNGPGELKPVGALVADPAPTVCVRGVFPGIENYYQLKLDPDEQTEIRMPSRLMAAPVTGMARSVDAVISQTGTDTEPTRLAAPIGINGSLGVRIIGTVVGSRGTSSGSRFSGQPFRLAGRTVPALRNRAISIHADPRLWSGRGEPPTARKLTTVVTNGKGHFRTRQLRLYHKASWVLTSRLAKPGTFDDSYSCNGALSIVGRFRPANFEDLDGRHFSSASIKGPGKKPKKIRIWFDEGEAWWQNGAAAKELVPFIGLNAGCNSMAGPYRIRDGRLRLKSHVVGTAMGCSDDRTGWIYTRLRKGVKASMAGRSLVLESSGGWRVKLKPRR